MTHAGRTTARRGRIALVSLVAFGAFLGSGASTASAQSVVKNTGTGCSGQQRWLVSCATAADRGGNDAAEVSRISAIFEHTATLTINALFTEEWGNGSTNRGGSGVKPTIDGGYPRSRMDHTWSHASNSEDTDIGGDGIFDPCQANPRRVGGLNVGIRGRTSDNVAGSLFTSNIKFVSSGGCSIPEDYAFLYSWGGNNFVNATTLNPTESKTFTYTGDDPDSAGDSNFSGTFWRVRDLKTGAIVQGPTLDCTGGTSDNQEKSTAVTFPDRGAFVVEAELRDGSGCTQQQNNGYWFPLGTADVNSAAAPTLSLNSATTTVGGVVRPNVGSDWTVRAQGLVDDDADAGGGAQILEWDLNNNNADGVDGYEETNYAAYDDVLDVGDTSGTDATQRNVDSSGQAPGLYSVRSRVTDNGAMDAADSSRRRSGAVTLQYRVDALPVVNNQTITTDTGATNVPVNLAATDSDGDTLAYTITDSPDHGTLSGGTTDDPTYTPTAGYAGTDSFTVQVSDGFGGTDTAVISFNVRPDTTITANPNNPSTTTSASFNFNSNGAPVSFQCQIDGGGFSACTAPQNYTGLGQGSHTFQVRAVATTGSVVDPSPASYTWVIDSVPPDTDITSAPPALSNSTSASFNFNSPDDGTATFECRLDSSLPGDWAACTAPKNYTSLGQGPHTFEVRAKDTAGNVDPSPDTHTWSIDSVAPTTTLNTFPDDPTNVTSASFGFTANESASFQCELDGGGFSPCTSAQVYAGPLSDGNHVFKVRATDPTGNTGNTVTYDWDIDTNEPETTIDVAPNSLTNQSMADFEFSSDESPNVSFQCRLDSSAPGDWQSCTSPKHYTGLTHGSHTFEVRATDAAGNTDQTPDTHTWTVDLINPATAIDDDTAPGNTHPSHRTTDNNASIDFFSNDGTATFQCRLDSSLESDFQPCTAPKSYTALSDGVHKFEVRAKDPAGNVDPTPAVWTWEIYNGLPDTIFDTYPDSPSNSANAQFTFHSSIPDSTFECSLDGEPLAPCDSPQDFTNLSEDTHTFTVVATDEFGRVDPAPAVYEWTVDLTDPDTTITAKPDDPSNVNTALFQFESTEPNSTFECKLDTGDWTACGEIQPEEYTNLDDGSHTFQVRATDAAGNVDETPASYTWVVDTAAPDTNITNQPANPSNINNPSFQFTSTEDPATFECRLDSSSPADWETCETDLQYTDLIEGSHTFEVRSTDEAGNTDASPASYTWYVDLTAPDTSITDGPDDPTNETLAIFTFNGSDNHSAAGDLTFECRIDSSDEGDWAACDSPEDFGGLSESSHTVEIRATDEAGNTDTAPASYTWVVDLTAPETTITEGPLTPTNSSDAHIEFTSENDATFECRLDSTNDADWAECDSPEDFSALIEGPHNFEVRATDTAGNTGPVATHSWIVDQSAPDTSITDNPADPSNDTSPSFEFSSTETGSSFECRLDSTDEEDWETCASAQSYAGPLGEGSHSFEVRATDQAQNTDATPASYTWTIDTGAPTATIDPPTPDDPTNDTDATFSFSSDESPSTFECKLDDGAFAACDSGTITYAGPLSEGSHTFQVKATDEAGNTGEVDEFTWYVDLTDPTAEFTATPTDPSNDLTPTFEFSGSDEHSDSADLTYECQLNGGGWTSCSSPDNSLTLPNASNTHTYEVRATDEAGNTSSADSYTWQLDVVEPDTTIGGNPANPSNDNSPTFAFNSTESNSSFECKLDSGEWEECDTGKTYSDVADGSHTFQVRAVDAAGNQDSSPASFTWEIDTVPPVIDISDGPDDPTNQTDASFLFTVEGASGDAKCGVDTPVPGEVCTSPADFTGLSEGTHTFYVQASDAAGNSTTATYNWRIDLTPPETNLDDTPSSVSSSGNASFGFNSNEEPVTYECWLDGSGYQPCTDPASYQGLGIGDHTFRVRATDEAGNVDETPAEYTWTVARQGVLGAGPPIIKKRIRSLNVPEGGAFQVATVTCRAGNCTLTKKSAKIKIGGKVYNGGISVDVIAKESDTSLTKGEVAQVTVHFSPEVRQNLAANHVGQLVVKLAATTDAGGASAFKKIKLKAKYLKALLG